MTVSAFHGLHGGKLGTPNGPVLPGGLDAWGNDVLPLHYQRREPDVMFLLHDIWVLNNEVLDQFPASSWCPVDHQPIPPRVLGGLKHCRWPVAMSRFGERMMKDAGLDPLYIPHGVETNTFKPVDRDEARRKWQVAEDVFLAVCVAANKGAPSRKSLDRILKAWSKFTRVNPDRKAILYLHSLPDNVHDGYDLRVVAKHYDVDPETLRFPDVYRMLMGEYTREIMNELYNAADVTLLPSMGEGFGIPVIEAQASGCPVIVTDFSAQSELVFGGYKIPVSDDDLVWTWQESEQANVKAGEIVKGLEWAIEQRAHEELRKQARDGVMVYDAQRVFDEYMHPAFKLMADVNRQEKATGKWDTKPAENSEPVPA